MCPDNEAQCTYHPAIMTNWWSSELDLNSASGWRTIRSLACLDVVHLHDQFIKLSWYDHLFPLHKMGSSQYERIFVPFLYGRFQSMWNSFPYFWKGNTASECFQEGEDIDVRWTVLTFFYNWRFVLNRYSSIPVLQMKSRISSISNTPFSLPYE